MKAKHQRLTLIAIALVALIAAALLAAWALRNQASYFYLPEQMQTDPPAVGQGVRLGGMVEPGSLKTLADGVTIAFTVTGKGDARVPVRFAGIVPDLFEEGWACREGSLQPDGSFRADNLLAKPTRITCPAKLEGMSQMQAAKMAEENTVGLQK